MSEEELMWGKGARVSSLLRKEKDFKDCTSLTERKQASLYID
jgi:hypothetical protein